MPRTLAETAPGPLHDGMVFSFCKFTRLSLLSVAAILAGIATPAAAQERDVPYFATIKPTELNMRVGPSERYRIRWVYRRAGLPVKIIRVMEGWRLIRDPDGAEGWVSANFLSPARSVIVTGADAADMRQKPTASSKLKWRVEPGVVATLARCDEGWCEVGIGRRVGWIEADRLWGDGAP